ncbi:hypothetical protein [Arthrobacter sp. PAMC25284]|uniref:hypothetical protein n=1 Tax=Arthrobacter sp. PAMC25284 TaxID=2861279 RepID=UPI001C633717|nr:hypothetical protein [Arthrobacter sp. PAMC25284]QYF91043.1 hypothetical protein KY499_07560 [Arthrobacter sp. PAMC25284]
MGLSDVLARAAVTRCHVFLAEVRDGAGPRMAVERQMARRGWVEALSPADADILCVCGEVPDGQAEALDRLWDQLPGPRARVNVELPDDVDRLDDCAAELLDTAAQRRREAGRAVDPDDDGGSEEGGGGMDHSGMDHSQMNHGDDDRGGGMDHSQMNHGDDDRGGGMDHSGMDHSGMDHSQMNHGGMDHGGMAMPMPGGIPLAGEGADRDGLNLDVLKVPLGPYLPLWPAGLVLNCELQGDVVFNSTVDFPFGPPRSGSGQPAVDDERSSLIHHLDLAERLLRLAGAAALATRTRRIRDTALDSAATDRASVDQCRAASRAVLARVRKDWLLRRTLRGLGRLPSDAGLPASEGADAWARLLGMFPAAAATTAPEAGPAAATAELPPNRDVVAILPDLIRGQELSVARLIIASFDLAPTAQKTAAQQAEVPG